MAIGTEVKFAHEHGALVDTFTSLPDLTAQIVPETSTTPKQSSYFVRFEYDDSTALRTALTTDHTVADADPVRATEEARVWAIEFTPNTALLAPEVTARGGFVVDARSAQPGEAPRGWQERWFFEDAEAIQAVWAHARSAGFQFEVVDLTQRLGGDVTNAAPDPLTPEQRHALESAYRLGYFDEPRTASLETLAAELDVSPSAVNGRLKRGLNALIGAGLPVEAAVIDRPRSQPGAQPARTSDDLQGRMITTHVYVTHPDLALTDTIRRCSDADISVLGDAATDPDRNAYFFRIEADDFAAIENALRADHTVKSFSTAGSTDLARTYRIEYTMSAELITPEVATVGGLTLASRSYVGGWLLQLQLAGHDELHMLSTYAASRGINFDVVELKQRDELKAGSEPILTPAQVAALVTAYRIGYYADPRRGSLAEVADTLGISNTAASGRLRRGSAALIEEYIDVGAAESSEVGREIDTYRATSVSEHHTPTDPPASGDDHP